MKLENLRRFALEKSSTDLLGIIENYARHVDAIKFDGGSYLIQNPDVAQAVESARGDNGYTHWVNNGQSEKRLGSGLSMHRNRIQRSAPIPEHPHIVLYSPVSALSGLGAAGRGYASVLKSLKQSTVEIIDSTAAVYPHIKSLKIAEPDRRPDIVIIHHNPDALGSFFDQVDRRLLDGAYVIGIWVWELPSFRPEWIEHFSAVDEVWAPSGFAAEAMKLYSPRHMPVNVVPHVIEFDIPAVRPTKSRFGLPEDAFVFLSTFDASSGMRRKNAEMVIDGFRQAFGDDEKTMLVIKCHSARLDNSDMRKIRAAADAPNIFVLDELLSDAENIGLKLISDVFVSPHRSEGFGMNIAEMMYLGKPVVTTGYSGNMQFCTLDNAYLVDFDLVEVFDGGPYPDRYVWAEPKLESLIEQLILAKKDAERDQPKGALGERAIKSTLSGKAVLATIEGLLGKITAESQNPDGPARRFADFDYVWRHPAALTGCSESGIENAGAWPFFSIIVPVYNIAPQLLEECVKSILNQTYPYWELCLCDDASTSQQTIQALESMRGLDQRIKIKRLKHNVGISGCSNAAVEFSTGEFVVFVDNDDTIEPDALLEYAKAIQNHNGVDLLYCDEDKISFKGEFVDHYMKPDWSPEHLESVMYVLHMLAVRKSTFLEMGGYREKYSGAQDYDLALRMSLAGRKIVHVPKVLYHWRMIPGSASAQVDAKPTALINAKAALDEYAKAKFGLHAFADDGLLYGHFKVCRRQIVTPPVTLLITTNNVSKEVDGRGYINLAENMLRSIAAATDYLNYKVILVSNGRIDDGLSKALKDVGGIEAVYSYTGSFNFARKANFAFSQAQSDIVVLLNDDMEIINSDWLSCLVEYISRSEIGAVGAKLLYPSGAIQHAGMAIGVNETAAHVYHGHPGDTVGYNGYPMTIRNYSAVTGACMATRKSIWQEVGGFDESLAIDFNDTDYCLKLREKGYRVVYNPCCELFHFESQTAVRHSQSLTEKNIFAERWRRVIDNDPYYSPNLRRDSITFEAKPDVWTAGRQEEASWL